MLLLSSCTFSLLSETTTDGLETTETPSNDDGNDDDTTPIIVGCVLAAIIVAVLVWYIFARSGTFTSKSKAIQYSGNADRCGLL